MKFNQLTSFSWSAKPAAATSLAGNIYKCVKIILSGGEGVPTPVTGVSDVVVGIQTTDTNGAGQAITMESNGIALAECGAAVTAGLEVSVMADGTIENKNSTNTIVGAALASGVAGDIISIKLKNM